MGKEFWRDWKRKTKLEKAAIKSLKSGKKIILKNIPGDQIIAIYVKGSFPRRELNKRSDVDLVTISKSTRQLSRFKMLEAKYGKEIFPKVELGGYSIWELKTGKRSKAKGVKKDRPGTSRILKHFGQYKLIYGKPLDTTNFPRKSNLHDLKSMITVFEENFIPSLKKKEMAFQTIIKQTFWLTENEQRYKGKSTPHNWKALNMSIKDPKHIIHYAYLYRKNPTKDKKLRSAYIQKLKSHLNKLRRELK